MDLFEVDKSRAAVTMETARSAPQSASRSPYVPPLQRTVGQPPPVAANGGLSYMSFDRGGDAGTAKAIEDALALATEGEGDCGQRNRGFGPKGIRDIDQHLPGRRLRHGTRGGFQHLGAAGLGDFDGVHGRGQHGFLR